MSKGTPLDRDERDAALERDPDLGRLRDLARGCRACALWSRATQTVFGEGATLHPSAVLRARSDERDAAYEGLVADLRRAADHLGRERGG